MAKTIVTTTTVTTTTVVEESQEVAPKKDLPPWEDFNHETHYYDVVNSEVKPNDPNKYGRCQNCGSIWSCWC
jgi:hypothetical protein